MWLTTDELNFVAAVTADLNGVSTAFPCVAIDMGRYTSMVAQVGVGLGSTYRIYAHYASTASVTAGSTGNMCIGTYRYSGSGTTASTADLLSARAALTTTGSSAVCIAATSGATVGVSTGPQVNVYLELKSDDLPAGYPYVAIAVSTSAQAHPCSVSYICKPRYPQNVMMPAGS